MPLFTEEVSPAANAGKNRVVRRAAQHTLANTCHPTVGPSNQNDTSANAKGRGIASNDRCEFSALGGREQDLSALRFGMLASTELELVGRFS